MSFATKRSGMCAGLLAALLTLAGCQTSDESSTMPTRDNIVRQPATFQGMDVVRASADFQPALDQPGACVSDEEILAAQLVRLHTELMVTGLTCHAAYRDPELFATYQNFTVNHQDRLRDGQEVLGRFLSRFQSGNYARLFDRFRTQMANYEGYLVMELTATQYCREQYGRFYVLADLDDSGLDEYLNAALETYRGEYRQCGSAELAPAATGNPG